MFAAPVEGEGALAAAEGEVGLARLTWPVNHAAHHGHMQALGLRMKAVEALEFIGDAVGGGANIDLGAAAGWAGGDPRPGRT